MSVSAICAIVGTAAALISAIIALSQYSKKNRLERSQYLSEILETLGSDPDISEIVYILEYDDSWYTYSFHNGNIEYERKMDKTIVYLSYICYLYSSHLISKNEFSLLKYYVHHSLSNSSLRYYLYNLYHFSCRILGKCSKQMNTDCTFKYLLEYGVKNNFIDDDFFNINSKQYPAYLNFR